MYSNFTNSIHFQVACCSSCCHIPLTLIPLKSHSACISIPISPLLQLCSYILVQSKPLYVMMVVRCALQKIQFSPCLRHADVSQVRWPVDGFGMRVIPEWLYCNSVRGDGNACALVAINGAR